MIFDLCLHNVILEWKTVSKLRLQIINILLAKYGYLLFTPANILFERDFLNCIPKAKKINKCLILRPFFF